VNRYGDARIVNSSIRYSKGPVDAAIPSRDWEIPVSTVRLVAELTTPGGPLFDYFYVFVAGDRPQMFRVPMESLEPVGLSVFFADLEAVLPGTLVHRLANSTSHASSVMWPSELVGEALFEHIPAPRHGLLGAVLDRVNPLQASRVNPSIAGALGSIPAWAV
jgi:hypothetical protein